MDKDKILSIVEQLSQNTLECYLSNRGENNFIEGTNIHGNNMTTDTLKEYFDKYKVGVDCDIEKIIFQPNGKEFLVTIKNNIVTCSKYADKMGAEEVTNTIMKLLQ